MDDWRDWRSVSESRKGRKLPVCATRADQLLDPGVVATPVISKPFSANGRFGFTDCTVGSWFDLLTFRQ